MGKNGDNKNIKALVKSEVFKKFLPVLMSALS